jgi:hypothetical protein
MSGLLKNHFQATAESSVKYDSPGFSMEAMESFIPEVKAF